MGAIGGLIRLTKYAIDAGQVDGVESLPQRMAAEAGGNAVELGEAEAAIDVDEEVCCFCCDW